MQIYDADKFVKKREFKLGGKVFDVSKIPARVAILINKEKERYQKAMSGDMDNDSFDFMMELFSEMLKRSLPGVSVDPDITPEWVEKHIDLSELVPIMSYLIIRSDEQTDAVEQEEKKTEEGQSELFQSQASNSGE